MGRLYCQPLARETITLASHMGTINREGEMVTPTELHHPELLGQPSFSFLLTCRDLLSHMVEKTTEVVWFIY